MGCLARLRGRSLDHCPMSLSRLAYNAKQLSVGCGQAHVRLGRATVSHGAAVAAGQEVQSSDQEAHVVGKYDSHVELNFVAMRTAAASPVAQPFFGNFSRPKCYFCFLTSFEV